MYMLTTSRFFCIVLLKGGEMFMLHSMRIR